MTESPQEHMSTIAVVPVYSEHSIVELIERFRKDLVDELCLVLDSPDSQTMAEVLEASGRIDAPVKLICNGERRGIGSAIRQGLRYALSRGFKVAVIMAGNGKDDPSEIPRLLVPIARDGLDYVQGSRYVPGGRPVNTPLIRRVITRMFPLMWILLTGFKCTDVTNGFRAYRLSILLNERVNMDQGWLDGYALEYYIHYKVITLGFKITEVPVSKVYRTRTKYSKISPLKDWWQILGPLITLRLGLRH